jgi:hypothetical protein
MSCGKLQRSYLHSRPHPAEDGYRLSFLGDMSRVHEIVGKQDSGRRRRSLCERGDCCRVLTQAGRDCCKADWEKHSYEAAEDGNPAKDRHEDRPPARPDIVSAHNCKSGNEQEDARHEDERGVAGDLFRELIA